MEKIAISVIMPVFNSERYVRSAVESVLSQDFESLELILVDDGSTDSSGRICDEYAVKDERVKVLHQKNAGTSAARNTGLAIACGEYITFCDHDDECLPHLLRDNFELACKNDADVVCFGCVGCCETPITETLLENIYDVSSIDTGISPDCYYKLRSLNVYGISSFNYVWNKLYKRELIQKLTFDSMFRHGFEDTCLNMQIASLPGLKFVISPSVYYKHIWRDNSSGALRPKKLDEKSFQEYAFVLEKEYELLKKIKPLKVDDESLAQEILIQNLYMLFQRLNLEELARFRKFDIFVAFPYRIQDDVKRLLDAFFYDLELFEKMCLKRSCITKLPRRTVLLKEMGTIYWETPLCGFFLNLYQSKKARWLFNLCNSLIRVLTFPFKLRK